MILGITGTNGGGKGEVVDYLAKQKGFLHFSVRNRILEEVVKRGLEPSRITIGGTGTALRQEHGPEYFTKTFMMEANARGAQNVVIESIRTLAEARYIQSQGGFIVAVDAPVQLRYERIKGRGTVTDQVSFEDFRIQEDIEYTSKDPSDPTQMNVLGVIAAADLVITNDGTLAELHEKIEKGLAQLGT